VNIAIDIKALSLNNCYRGRRFSTTAKKQYDRALQLLLPKVKVEGPRYTVTLRFFLKDCFRGDLDNLAKVLIDNIVKREIISNDRNVVEIHLYKRRAPKDRIEIEVESLVGESL
jgi:Holliday junction resolvase RusA-like endonuclease